VIDEKVNDRLYRTFQHGSQVSTEAFETKGPVNPVPVDWALDDLGEGGDAEIRAWHVHNVQQMEARRVEG